MDAGVAPYLFRKALLLLVLFGLMGGGAQAEEATGVVERTGSLMPLDAVFVDAAGRDVHLGELIDRPTLLLPVYYTCPQICSFDMANLALALQRTSLPADSFSVITMSFNAAETSEDAARTRRNYTAMLEGIFPTGNWHFLTGTDEEIRKVTEAIGYTFRPAGNGLFVHPSALVALAEDGTIIKYVYGSFLVGDVDLALTEAGRGVPAVSIKRFLAYCLTSDGKRREEVFLVLKSAVILLVFGGGYLLFRLLAGRGRRGDPAS